MIPPPDSLVFQCGAHHVPLNERVHLMGILNVTPDSFSDGGRYLDPAWAVEHAVEMEAEGADFIDIGAESTRPGAEPVDEAEEWRRLAPVVDAVCRRVRVPVSVDTMKAAVAERALGAGAAIINDVSALRADPAMAGVVARAGAGLVLMHMKGTPRTMQHAARYDDVVAEVEAFLGERVRHAVEEGVRADHIMVDPGIGFAKTGDHNVTLIASLERLTALGRPVLIGISRKAFIGRLTGRAEGDRAWGTAAAVASAVAHGARVVRVHDVGAMRDVVRTAEAIERASILSRHSSAVRG